MVNNFLNETDTLLIHQLTVFDDNYIYVAQFKGTSDAFVVDPGESELTLQFIQQQNLNVKWFLITHEHDDHIGGLSILRGAFPTAKIICHPSLNEELKVDQRQAGYTGQLVMPLDSLNVQVIELAGHTSHHLAFHFPEEKVLFCGDILFGLGCGRIISGSYEQQFESMQFFKAQSDQTRIFCAHEYTRRNFQFITAQLPNFPGLIQKHFALEENNLKDLLNGIDLRLKDQKRTVPLSLGVEKKYNPFLISKTFHDFKIVRELRNKF